MKAILLRLTADQAKVLLFSVRHTLNQSWSLTEAERRELIEIEYMLVERVE